LVWACTKNEENRIPPKLLDIYLETVSLRSIPRNRCKGEVSEDERLVCGKGWEERVYNIEDSKKLLRTARNCRILHMPVE